MSYNKQNKETKAGSQEQNEPRLIRSIVEEMLHGRSLLAQTCCEQLHPHTELNVDLKLMTRQCGCMPVGAYLLGSITRNGEEHYTFYETKSWGTGKRNPHVFEGEFITITRRSDGSLRPNFKLGRIGGRGFILESYAFGVACELREALRGLIEED